MGQNAEYKYILYENDIEIDRGTTSYLANKYNTSQSSVFNAYILKYKLCKKYSVKRTDNVRTYKINYKGKEYVGTLEEVRKQTGLSESSVRLYEKGGPSILTKKPKILSNKTDWSKNKQEIIDETIRIVKRDSSLPPYYKTLIGGKRKDVDEIKKQLGSDYSFVLKKDRDGKYWEITNVKLARRN